MYRRPATTDPTLIHLWIDDDHTVCGFVGDQLAARGTVHCGSCIQRFGADVAARFDTLVWLGSSTGGVIHAFDPEAQPVGGRWLPTCGHYALRPSTLRPRPLRQRCPHCVKHLDTKE